jgi:putative addiction module component (TIGR02574 family)
MAVMNEKLLDEVLALPIDLRNNLIEKLIESLNLPLEKNIDELWAEEADRRAMELENGDVQAIPGEIVFKEIRKRYQK